MRISDWSSDVCSSDLQAAKSVNEQCRGQHREFVFVYAPPPRKSEPGEIVEIPVPRPVGKMNNTAWKSARVRAAEKWEQERGEPAVGRALCRDRVCQIV